MYEEISSSLLVDNKYLQPEKLPWQSANNQRITSLWCSIFYVTNLRQEEPETTASHFPLATDV